MTLKLVPPPEPEAWAQRAGEEEAEYLLFTGWLLSGTPRAAPSYPGIAASKEWTDRANAYDTAHALPATPAGKAARGFHDLENVFSAEARKLSNEALKSGASRVLTTKEILALGMVLLENRDDLKRILESEDETGLDVSELTEDELRAVQSAHKALAKMGKKGKL